MPLSNIPREFYGAEINPDNTFVFGWSPCGDMLIYTSDDRSGWACHENGKIHLLGSTADTLEWTFAELLADKCPEWDGKSWG